MRWSSVPRKDRRESKHMNHTLSKVKEAGESGGYYDLDEACIMM
jgi:hypothetical protein